MRNNRTRAAILTCMLIGTSSAEAIAESVEQIPTQLMNPPLPNDPDGSCSLCRIFPLAPSTSTPSTASFDLSYEDDGDDASADIEVQVLLDNDEYRTVFIDDVGLVHDQTSTFVVTSGSDWTWEDARHAWVTIHETSS